MKQLIFLIIILVLLSGCNLTYTSSGLNNTYPKCSNWHNGAYQIGPGGIMDALTNKTYIQCCYSYRINKTVEQFDKVIHNPIMTECTYLEERKLGDD